jgi:hypothetical protein
MQPWQFRIDCNGTQVDAAAALDFPMAPLRWLVLEKLKKNKKI